MPRKKKIEEDLEVEPEVEPVKKPVPPYKFNTFPCSVVMASDSFDESRMETYFWSKKGYFFSSGVKMVSLHVLGKK